MDAARRELKPVLINFTVMVFGVLIIHTFVPRYESGLAFFLDSTLYVTCSMAMGDLVVWLLIRLAMYLASFVVPFQTSRWVWPLAHFLLPFMTERKRALAGLNQQITSTIRPTFMSPRFVLHFFCSAVVILSLMQLALIAAHITTQAAHINYSRLQLELEDMDGADRPDLVKTMRRLWAATVDR